MESPKKIKIGIVCICLNESYWQFASEMLWGLDTFFLKHHSIRDKYETEFMIWSDIPEEPAKIQQRLAEYMLSRGEAVSSVINQTDTHILISEDKRKDLDRVVNNLTNLRKLTRMFEAEPIEWPMPTLMRYHLFLQQEEYLRNFDYIFYIDVDMRITDWIGEEILGDGLTAAQHPMYALRENLFAPYDPNPNSEAHIRLPGSYIDDGKGGKKFRPEYYAGGFQGGKTDVWIKAMKGMRDMIDRDFGINYIPRWNDESIFNSYIFRYPDIPKIVLSPSYIYPDSLIDTYYIKLWGRNYSPKIMTLTKAFTISSEGGQAVNKMMATM